MRKCLSYVKYKTKNLQFLAGLSYLYNANLKEYDKGKQRNYSYSRIC
ncbi:hypothetical protein MuYL_2529 [Mucilaginibacter xinganensis]|uniref:Uncharacterized protein n=1 Tax=Mucilaginibacter xinganensis TaxID=1234841 RepID=A0A223NX63_9SPHI|nr:hypothetical protein MuYL_2529 [Mucilaginibacter xinganensis]